MKKMKKPMRAFPPALPAALTLALAAPGAAVPAGGAFVAETNFRVVCPPAAGR